VVVVFIMSSEDTWNPDTVV